ITNRTLTLHDVAAEDERWPDELAPRLVTLAVDALADDPEAVDGMHSTSRTDFERWLTGWLRLERDDALPVLLRHFAAETGAGKAQAIAFAAMLEDPKAFAVMCERCASSGEMTLASTIQWLPGEFFKNHPETVGMVEKVLVAKPDDPGTRIILNYLIT